MLRVLERQSEGSQRFTVRHDMHEHAACTFSLNCIARVAAVGACATLADDFNAREPGRDKVCPRDGENRRRTTADYLRRDHNNHSLGYRRCRRRRSRWHESWCRRRIPADREGTPRRTRGVCRCFRTLACPDETNRRRNEREHDVRLQRGGGLAARVTRGKIVVGEVERGSDGGGKYSGLVQIDECDAYLCAHPAVHHSVWSGRVYLNAG